MVDDDRVESWVASVDELLDNHGRDSAVGRDAMRWTPDLLPVPTNPLVPRWTPEDLAQVQDAFQRTFGLINDELGSILRAYAGAVSEVGRKLTAAFGPLIEERPPVDLQARALWLQKHRDTGPALPPLRLGNPQR
jgi:hypothetical protein